MSFVGVQRDLREGDREVLGDQRAHHRISASELADFSDTAAVLALCDLVITVDTSVAHLAGALGRPLWILLPFWPDWRWTLDRDASPWYPDARLFRQGADGDWDPVIERVSVRDLDQTRELALAALPQRLDALAEGARPLGEQAARRCAARPSRARPGARRSAA